jgi:Phasin protein
MAKSPFDVNALEGQQKMMKATKELGAVAMESAQSINQINQQAAQELAALVQKRVAELIKTQDPKSAFDYVHAEVLQDATKEVTQYHQKLLKVLNQGNKELAEIAESMIEDSKADLIHFVNDATNNTPKDSQAYVSVFKTSFNTALQNFELIRAAMADSFSHFEKSVENVNKAANSPVAGKKTS